MAVSERTSLLDEKSNVRNAYPRNYIIQIVIILCLFGGNTGYVAFNQYVVSYFKEHVTNSSNVLSGPSHDNNTSDNCDGNSTNAQEDMVQKESARFLVYLQLAEYAFGIPSVFFFGVLSEIYGRKIFMILSLFGTFLKYTVLVLVIYLELSINWTYIGFACQGILGSAYGFFMCCSVSIADVTDTGQSRTFQLALLNYFQGIGLTASQLSAGYIIAQWGFRIPLMLSAGTSILSVLLLAVIMRETLNLNTISKVPRNCASVSKSFLACSAKGIDRKATPVQLIVVLTALIVSISPATSRPAVDILYLLGSPFCFSSKAIGWFEAARELIMLNVGTGVLKLMLFCMRDEVIAILGCLSGILCYCGMALATKEWMLYAAIGSGILNLVPMPLLRAIYSKMVSRDNQGAAFGSIYVLEAICGVSSSTLFFNIYAETRSIFRGMVYLVFCVFNVGCIILLIFIMTFKKEKKKPVQEIKINVD